MAIGANSYGTAAGVGSLVPRYANTTGTFDTYTTWDSTKSRPNLATVEAQINQVSGLVNSILAEYGFSIPVNQADVVLLLTFFVEQEVAAIVEGINGSGRFGPSTKEWGGKGRFALLVEDVQKFIKAQTVGFERMGATRTYTSTSGLAFRDTDERGNETFPLFQRAAFGEVFTDWDSA